MVTWQCCPNGDEPDLWTAWHRKQSDAVKGRHAAVLRFIVQGHWTMPRYKLLKGKAAGLGEIRVGSGVEWRLVGHHDMAASRFTVVMICYHKGNVYTPRDALKTAAARWAEMQGGLEGVAVDVHPS